MTATRSETDSFGPLEVPADKYWGAQTQRSIQNFPIGWERQPVAVVRALGVIKKACALANKAQGTLDARYGRRHRRRRGEVVEGRSTTTSRWSSGRPGSGTQSNMNANEVIANRAIEMLGGTLGSKDPVHPNDHCNMGQSLQRHVPHRDAHRHRDERARRDPAGAAQAARHAGARNPTSSTDIIKIGRTHTHGCHAADAGRRNSRAMPTRSRRASPGSRPRCPTSTSWRRAAPPWAPG